MKTTGNTTPSQGVRALARCLAIVVFLTLLSRVALADRISSEDRMRALASMTIEELGTLEIDITAKEEEQAKDAFNIVSVLTREDIRQAHPRDIGEVLQLIPGFNLVQDVTYLSLSARGLYGFEGRVLFMVNRIPVSDLQFGGFPLNHHIPISAIKRIEVIRGPGSVLYGGTAELSVVNIVTDEGEDIKGGKISGRLGSYASGIGMKGGTVAIGDTFQDGQYSFVLSESTGRLSDGISSEFGRMPAYRHNEESAGEETEFITGQLNYKGLSAKFIYDGLRVNRVYPTNQIQYEDAESAIEGRKYGDSFKVIGGSLSHESALSENVRMFGGAEYLQSIPYEVDYRGEDIDSSTGLIGDQAKVERYKVTGHLSYAHNGTELVGGGEAAFDHASLIRDPSSRERGEYRRFPSDGPEQDIDIQSHALFGTAKHKWELKTGKVTLSAGARLDESELYSGQVSPRLGVVYDAKDFTAKLLYNSAFRAPLVGNSAHNLYGLDPEKPWRKRVIPESSNVYEAEVGYTLWEGATLTTNVFYQQVSDVIEFRFDPERQDVYSSNGGRIGTYGFESELRVREGRYRSISSVSYFEPDFTGGLTKGGETYIDPEVPHSLLGVPTWKLSSLHSYTLSDRVSAQALLLMFSSKRTNAGWGLSERIDPELIVTTGLLVDRFLDISGLSLEVALHDLLDQGPSVATPFRDSGADVTQYRGREIVVGLEFRF